MTPLLVDMKNAELYIRSRSASHARITKKAPKFGITPTEVDAESFQKLLEVLSHKAKKIAGLGGVPQNFQNLPLVS